MIQEIRANRGRGREEGRGSQARWGEGVQAAQPVGLPCDDQKPAGVSHWKPALARAAVTSVP